MATNGKLTEIATRIMQRRKELKLSLQDVADIAGISRSTLQRYESGGIKNIPIQRLDGLAKALKTSPEWIMGTRQDGWYSALIDLYRELNLGPIPSPEEAALLLQKDRKSLLPFLSDSDFQIQAFVSQDEEFLIYCYRQFTEDGQQKIREYMADLSENSRYTKIDKTSDSEQ